MKNSLIFSVVCAAALVAPNAFAETITFTGASGDALTTYAEAGYTIRALAGGADLSLSFYGNPNDSIFAKAQNASFELTRSAGAFSFSSFQVDSGSYNPNVNDSFSVVGFLGNSQVFNQSGTKAGGPEGNFTTVTSNSSAPIDRLVFTVTAFSSGLNFDNIVVNPVAVAAVPEPATWAMLLIGFGMIGAASRYRRRSTITTFA